MSLLTANNTATVAKHIMAKEVVEEAAEAVRGRASTLLPEDSGSILMNLFFWLVQGL